MDIKEAIMQTLKTKIFQYFALITLLITLVVGIYVLLYVRNSLINEAQKAIERSAKDGAQIIAARNENQFVYLEGIAKANRFQFPESTSLERMKRLEEEVLEYTLFTRVGIADLDGHLYMLNKDNSEVLTIDVTPREYYKDALSGNRGFMNPNETINPEYLNQLVVAYAVPIYESDQIKGALVATSLSNLVTSLMADMGYGDSGYAYLLDSNGTVVAHPDQFRVDTKQNIYVLAENSNTYREIASLVKQSSLMDYGKGQYRLLDDTLFVGYAKVPNSNWTIFVTAKQNEVLKVLDPLLSGFFLVIILMITLNVIAYLRIRSELNIQSLEVQSKTEKLTELAMIDALTGAYNRHVCEKYVEEAIVDSLLNQTHITVVFIDIDRLKHVNDTFGHDLGDDYILSVTKTIRLFTRSSDKLFRLGGDEFMLLLSFCNASDAKRIMNTIESSLTFDKIPVEPSISYGIVQHQPDKHKNVQDLIKEADALMYEHKKTKPR